MIFFTSLKKTFLNTFNYKGRASKYEFFYYSLFYILVSEIFYFTAVFVFLKDFNSFKNLYISILIIMLIPYISLACRRLHDMGKNSLFVLFGLYFPFLPIFIFLLTIYNSDKNNKYGKVPDDAVLKYNNIIEYLSENNTNKKVKVSILQSIKYGLTYGYLDFSGRATRLEFFSIQIFLYSLLIISIMIPSTTYDVTFNTDIDLEYFFSNTMSFSLVSLYFLVFTMPLLSSITRRFHDLNIRVSTLIFKVLSVLLIMFFLLFIMDTYYIFNPFTYLLVIFAMEAGIFVMAFLKGNRKKNNFGHSIESYNKSISL